MTSANGAPARAGQQHVVFFLPSLAGGGAERVTLDLCRALARGGTSVTLVVATGDSRQSPLWQEMDFEVVDLGAARTLAAVVPLARLVRRLRPDAVTGVMAHAGLVVGLAVRLARTDTTPVVMLHNTMSVSIQGSENRRDRLVPWLAPMLWRGAVVTSVSEGAARDFERLTRGRVRPVRVLPNPIDYEAIDRRSLEHADSSPEAPRGRRNIVAAGRLVDQKDFATLLEAVRGLRGEWQLTILGEGPLRPALEAQIREAELCDRVTLAGFVANPYPVFRAADLFVLSSRWEGLPTVLLEVMAFDTAVVATDCPSGPREIFSMFGVEQELVPVGDPAALREAIASGASGPPVARRAEIRQEYGPAAVADKFLALLRR